MPDYKTKNPIATLTRSGRYRLGVEVTIQVVSYHDLLMNGFITSSKNMPDSEFVKQGSRHFYSLYDDD